MPWGDRTGPLGQGPKTGRGLGFCAGYDSPGYTKGTPAGRGYGFGRGWFGRGWGRGLGFGRGVGWRWNWSWPQTASATEPQKTAETSNSAELSAMKNELNSLKSAVEGLLNRISALSEKGDKSSGE